MSPLPHAVPRPVSAVLFDLDGVIVDTARIHFAAWKRLAAQLAIDFNERQNAALKGVDRLRSLELLLGFRAADYDDDDKLELAETKNRWYVEALEELGPTSLLPGARDALEQVRRAGLGVGLASASRNAAFVIDRLGISRCFDVVVDAATIAHGKPAPDIFLAGARLLGAAPEACLGIEDAAAGVAAIKAAGMAAIGVGEAECLPGADWILPDLTGFNLAHYRSEP